jgi:membrane protein DedA with SNARE-associated domain
VILISGYLAGLGRINLAGALVSSVLGSLCGASLLFFLGLAKGRPFFRRGKHLFFSPERLGRVEGWFDQHGSKVVLVSRFLAGVRSLVALTAGIGRMPYGLFLVFSLVSISLWNGLLMLLGLRLGQNWGHVVGLFRLYNGLIVLVVVLGIFLWYLKRRFRPKFPSR